MTTLVELYDETLYIFNELEEVEYERLIELVDLRERVLSELQVRSIVEENDKKMIKEIIALDDHILGRMEQLKAEASDALNKFRLSKIEKQVLIQI